jgi:hypothetical protein
MSNWTKQKSNTNTNNTTRATRGAGYETAFLCFHFLPSSFGEFPQWDQGIRKLALSIIVLGVSFAQLVVAVCLSSGLSGVKTRFDSQERGPVRV